jgi:hypothetical protein
LACGLVAGVLPRRVRRSSQARSGGCRCSSSLPSFLGGWGGIAPGTPLIKPVVAARSCSCGGSLLRPAEVAREGGQPSFCSYWNLKVRRPCLQRVRATPSARLLRSRAGSPGGRLPTALRRKGGPALLPSSCWLLALQDSRPAAPSSRPWQRGIGGSGGGPLQCFEWCPLLG